MEYKTTPKNYLKTINHNIFAMVYLNKTKKGAVSTSGLNVAMNAIFILGIGLGVAQGVIAAGNFSGLTSTIIAFVPVLIVAGYMYSLAKNSGVKM